MAINKLSSGWWLTYPSEKYDFVSWDDDVPNILMKSHKNSMVPVTTNKSFIFHYQRLNHH